MIKITQVPPGVATGATYLVEANETLCKPYCATSLILPAATFAFKALTPSVNDGVAVVPVEATITATTPSIKGCGCAHTQLFKETVNVPLTATTENTVTLTPSDQVDVSPAVVRCNKVTALNIGTILEITIA